jgi:exo-beta-1,3-glucanase (GH17 family)/cellulose synthase/poly-beta-1,6-N-acetylglucosamine synthase-like glycosyltransferase
MELDGMPMSTALFILPASVFLAVMFFLHVRYSSSRPPPKGEPPRERLSGLCYSPFRMGQSPHGISGPTESQIREDLALLKMHTDNIRIYSVHGILGSIPALAKEYGLSVMLGAWIGPDDDFNTRELMRSIEIANTCENVSALVVGNECLFRGDVSVEQLTLYINLVKAATAVPVSCSEQWHIWEQHPELANDVDFIAAHILPFWEAVPQRDVHDAIYSRIELLQELFPNRSIIFSEVGWPSKGYRSNTVQASRRQQATYIRDIVEHMKRRRHLYYIIEAFDQPWKTEEGEVGAHWGIFSSEREPKFSLQRATSSDFDTAALKSMVIDGLSLQGRSTAALMATAFLYVAVIIWLSAISSRPYPSFVAVALSAMILLGTSLNLFTEIHEWLEAAWTPTQKRIFLPVLSRDARRQKVSIHVPCYNEPPDMVIKTLDALANLNYSDYEVIVVDNNTKSSHMWEPVERHCKQLGPRFKFFHVPQLSGYKGGALNFALAHTSPDSVIVGVVDSDYQVDRDWLRMMTPHMNDPSIAIVQCPQDYYDRYNNRFKRFCFSEYRGFFNIGMVVRNNYNAIIQHGTMTLVRREVLDQLKWAEWCITEDAELGLRIMQNGYSTAYTLQSCGKGLVPDSFTDFKKQRFRWAYGAVQILKFHRVALYRDGASHLTRSQRYHFLAGWLPWVNEAFNAMLIGAALTGSALMLTFPTVTPPPVIIPFSIMMIFFLKIVKTLHLYRRLVDVDFRDALAAIIAGMALSHTIAKAVLYGFFTTSIPFFRTPKNADSHGLLVAISEAREELFIMLLLWGAALGICLVQGLPSNDMRFWVTMLLVQSLPYLAALIMAFLSSLPKPKSAEEPATA